MSDEQKVVDPNVIEFAIGGMHDFPRWYMHLNEHYGQNTRDYICPHSNEVFRGDPLFEVRHSWDGRDLSDKYQWIVPRVVVAYNEGGFNSTSVCLDCILEALRKQDGVGELPWR